MSSVCCYGTLVMPMSRSLVGLRLAVAAADSACQSVTAGPVMRTLLNLSSLTANFALSSGDEGDCQHATVSPTC